MKINKVLILVLIALFIIAPINVSAQTYTNTTSSGKKTTVNITSVNVDGRENQTTVSGTKPLVTSNNFGTTTINDKIDSIYKDETKSAANDRAKSISFNYEVYDNKEYISVVILSKVQNVTESTSVNVVNFSSASGKIIKIKDVLGGKPIDVVSNYVNKILKQDGKYNTTVTITEDATFYIENDVPTLVFDSYSLGSNQSKVVTIPLNLSNITSFQLSSKEYFIKDNFNIRMIPLRKTCEGLYYNVSWNPKNRTFTVSDSNITSTGSMNSIQYSGGSKKVSLEYKPENRNGNLYVPISYFTDVLGLSYKIDNQGNITFYKIN